jgi:hypothetical protein
MKQITETEFSNIMMESTSVTTEDKAGLRLNHFEHPELGSGVTIQGSSNEYLLILGLATI